MQLNAEVLVLTMTLSRTVNVFLLHRESSHWVHVMLSQLATVCVCVYLCDKYLQEQQHSMGVCVCVALCSINVNKFSSFNWNTSASLHEMSKKFRTKFKNFAQKYPSAKDLHHLQAVWVSSRESTRLTKSFALGQDAHTHSHVHTQRRL